MKEMSFRNQRYENNITATDYQLFDQITKDGMQ